MVTTIFPTLWPEVSALCASRNWLKWNFRMGGTEILPPSIQLLSCFKYFSPVSISSEKKLLGYKRNFCAIFVQVSDSQPWIQQQSSCDFLADGFCCFPRSRLNPRTAFESKVKNIGSSVCSIRRDASVVKPMRPLRCCEANVSRYVSWREFFPSVKMRCADQIDRHANPI